MSLDQRIEEGLRQRPSDERIYSEPLPALGDSRGVEGVTTGPTRRSTARRGAVPALAAFCAILALAAGALLFGVVGPWRATNMGGSQPPSGSPGVSGSPEASGSPLASGSPPASSPSQPTSPKQLSASASPGQPSGSPGSSYMQYQVRTGDYLAKIAAKFNLKLWEIELANPDITNFDHIEVGQWLNIPPAGLLTQPPAPTASPGSH
jgi:LysM repeat protein